MKETKESIQNNEVLITVSRELFTFMEEILHDYNLGRVKKKFDNLTQEEIAVFKVKARIIVNTIMRGWA